MKIFILSNDDLTSNLIFAPLFRMSGIEIVGLAFPASPASGTRSTLAGALALRHKMDSRYWLYLVATNGLFRLFDVLSNTLHLSPQNGDLVAFAALARDRSIPVIVVDDFNSANPNRCPAKRCDLLIIRIGTILDAELLSLPFVGTWCVHSSLLPSFRGIAGEFHALRIPDAPIGSTVFEVAPQFEFRTSTCSGSHRTG